MNITGIIKVIRDEETVSDKFKKREFVLTDNSSQYPQHISFQLTQDRCDLLNSCRVGDKVDVSFNLRGREWTSPQGEVKYFNTLEAWRLNSLSEAQTTQQPVAQQPVSNQQERVAKDDLPF